MEDVNFKVWRIFFKEAGLTKVDQVKYAQSFSHQDVEMKSFCCMVSQHTDSSISFMKSLGVGPAGHQIKISNRAREDKPTKPVHACIKIEIDEEVEEPLQTPCGDPPLKSIPHNFQHPDSKRITVDRQS